MRKQALIKAHPTLQYFDAIKQICSPLKTLGINYFCHVRIYNAHEFSFQGGDPEFIRHYIENDFFYYDLHAAKSAPMQAYVIWDHLQRSNESKKVHDDFGQFGFGHTFSIIHNNGNYRDYFHFAAPIGSESINLYYMGYLDELNRFISYFMDKSMQHPSLRKAYDLRLELANNKMDFYIENETINQRKAYFNRELTLQAPNVYVDHKGRYLQLSPRENEVLNNILLGISAKQLALKLRISARTVETHLQKIKTKFNCKSTKELFSLMIFSPHNYHQVIELSEHNALK